jgi:phasin family protein
MYPFSQSVTPALRSHLDAQVSFVNDMSKSLFQSFQQLCDLNIQLTQTMLEEATQTSQQLLTADRQTDVIGAAASRAQPATEKLRAYQQHISRVAADAQVQLARVTEQHVQETTQNGSQRSNGSSSASMQSGQGGSSQGGSAQGSQSDSNIHGGSNMGSSGSASGKSGAAGATPGKPS